MTWLFLGVLYGIGFGLTLVGSTLWVLVLGGLHTDVSFVKWICWNVFWPFTWAKIAFEIWRTDQRIKEVAMKKDNETRPVVEKDGQRYVVMEPGFMDKPILDKDGKPLTAEETQEYWDDVFDGGIPMTKSHAMWLHEKWGERLGIKKPE